MVAELDELLAETKIHGDRVRLTAILVSLVTSRGERLEELEAQVEEAISDSTEAEELQMAQTARSHIAFARGRLEEAYRHALDAARHPAQASDYAARVAMRPAIWLRDPEKVRAAYESGRAMYQPSPYNAALARLADGAEAAFTGRTDEARRLLIGVVSTMRELDLEADAAFMTVDALVALPDEPEIRALADAARSTIEALRASVFLARLDEILASSPAAASADRVAAQRA